MVFFLNKLNNGGSLLSQKYSILIEQKQRYVLERNERFITTNLKLVVFGYFYKIVFLCYSTRRMKIVKQINQINKIYFHTS